MQKEKIAQPPKGAGKVSGHADERRSFFKLNLGPLGEKFLKLFRRGEEGGSHRTQQHSNIRYKEARKELEALFKKRLPDFPAEVLTAYKAGSLKGASSELECFYAVLRIAQREREELKYALILSRKAGDDALVMQMNFIQPNFVSKISAANFFRKNWWLEEDVFAKYLLHKGGQLRSKAELFLSQNRDITAENKPAFYKIMREAVEYSPR